MSGAAGSHSRRGETACMFADMRDRDISRSSPAELLAEQERSGLTIAAFARKRGVAPWKLDAARRRAEVEVGTARDRFAAVTVVDSRPQVVGFELDFPDGRRVFIPRGFDGDDLARLVKVLSEC